MKEVVTVGYLRSICLTLSVGVNISVICKFAEFEVAFLLFNSLQL